MSSEDCQEEIRGKYDNYSIFDVRRPLGKWQHLCVYLFGNSSFMVEMCRREGPLCKRTPNDEKPLTVQNIDKNLLLAKLPKATRWQNMPNYNRLVFIWHVGSKLMMLRTMCKLCKVELANIFQGWHWQTRPGIVWLGSLSVSVIPKSTKSFGWRKRFFRCHMKHRSQRIRIHLLQCTVSDYSSASNSK